MGSSGGRVWCVELRRGGALAIGLLATALALDAPAVGQQLAGELLYTSIQPCRIVDTRLQVAGALAANTGRTFHVVGDSNDFVAQGGKAGGCDIPGFVDGAPAALAVMVNLVAVDPEGKGHLRAYPTDAVEAPLASAINFADLGTNIANGLTVPLRQDSEGGDITLFAAFAQTHVVADVVGFFSPARPRRYYLTPDEYLPNVALDACADGFHMASLWEILDVTVLQYDSVLGLTATDMGGGPVTGIVGWVRTGIDGSTSGGPGGANCDNYTVSDNVTEGTAVELPDNWSAVSTVVSPWIAYDFICGSPNHVWCVEDR